MSDLWKKIGTVGRPFGLRGAFFVGERSSLLPAVYRGKELRVGPDPEGGQPSRVVSYAVQKERAVITMAGFMDRTAVEQVNGQALWAPADIPEHSYAALVGCQVVDNSGRRMGLIHEFYNHGGADNVELSDGAGLFLELPFVDAYFDWPQVTALLTSPEVQQAAAAERGRFSLQVLVPGEVFEDLWSSVPGMA